ncbi:anthranilate phosphoribosyltransferase [Tistrella bauzanensis]|uniref:anthranilate phosphoribosyltransferase n=1 Tax=Tistrella TaxID=171436 RepID=UPI0031F64E49
MSSQTTGQPPEPAPEDFRALIARVADGHPLTRDQARDAFRLMMGGEATPAQIGGFLMALRVRGETVDEITAGAEVMRAKAMSVRAPDGAVDTCGTGGDARGTFNISTAASLIVAACGVPVAKHGNRALSSKSGSADVLKALGLNIDADLERVERAGRDAGFCFMMAPRHHAAMLNVAGPRVELGTRTIFNLLGPLANPAGTRFQLMGVFAARWVEPVAHVLRNLGSERAWVVHGRDGLDEITITGETDVAELVDGEVRRFTIAPEMVGLDRYAPDDLKGGDAATNAAAIQAMLAGAPGALRDVALLNAAATLVIAGATPDLATGVARAREALDSGRATTVLDRVIAITNGREG